MATRNKSSKTTKRASADIDFVPYVNLKAQRATSNAIKSAGTKVLVIALVILLISAALGVGVCFALTRNDCFDIVGDDKPIFCIGENYIDEGVRVIAFGKNYANKVEIETNLKVNSDGSFTSNEEGTFHIIYRVNNLKYGTIFKVQRIRLVTFVEASEGGE